MRLEKMGLDPKTPNPNPYPYPYPYPSLPQILLHSIHLSQSMLVIFCVHKNLSRKKNNEEEEERRYFANFNFYLSIFIREWLQKRRAD